MMRVALLFGFLLPAAACGSLEIGAPPAPPPVPPAAGGVAPTGAVAEMAALVDAHRLSAGCPRLLWLDGAARAAQAHSDDMARRGFFAHVSPDGGTLAQRLRDHGIGYRSAGENIALSNEDPAGVLRGWVRSAPHRRNLENCAFTHHGIGTRNGRWTHVLVTPAAP